METNMDKVTFLVTTTATAESITTHMASIDSDIVVGAVGEMFIPPSLQEGITVGRSDGEVVTLTSLIAVADKSADMIANRETWLDNCRRELSTTQNTLNKVWAVIKEHLVEEGMDDPEEYEITKRLLDLGMPPFSRTVECTFRCTIDVTMRVNNVPLAVSGDSVMDALATKMEYALSDVSPDEDEITVRDRDGNLVYLSDVTLYDCSAEIDESDNYDED